jgi:hypothetical protein
MGSSYAPASSGLSCSWSAYLWPFSLKTKINLNLYFEFSCPFSDTNSIT